ncbi:protein-export chaperone SecB [Metabacillus sp. FJAT-52054]|uniref:Protein-export chaperone SecB n=1 Tax=Metabacillus sediminis TaxID=3117746 RepID=A0ABZ2NJF0_9BACI
MASKLDINKVIVEQSIYKTNLKYNYELNEIDPEIGFEVEVLIAQSDETKGIIKLECHINDELPLEEVPFNLKVVLLGHFKTEQGDKFENYILNAISILFPYMRAHISTLTAISGQRPLMIPSVNVVELLKEKAEKNN